MPITSEGLAVAVREDDDVPRVRVLPERHRDLRLPTGEGLQLCAHRMLQSPLRTPAPGMAVIEHRYLGLHPPPALGVEKARRKTPSAALASHASLDAVDRPTVCLVAVMRAARRTSR